MKYKIKRYSQNLDSFYRPNILDLPRVERKLYESGLSKREVDIIIDDIRDCNDPESIMKWVKTGEIEDPRILKIMDKTGLSFPAAYIESQKHYSMLLDEEELESILNSGVDIKSIMKPRYNPDGSPDRVHGLFSGAIRGAATGFIFG